MRLHKKKNWTSLILIVLLLSLTTGVFANSSFYEKIDTEKLSRGVTHSHIMRFTQEGWLNANVLYVDLKDDTLSLDLLQSAGGVSTKETLSTMVKRQEKVVGAINGDFFYLTNPDSPMGIMAKDGKIISSPVINHKLGTLYVDKNNNAFVDYLDYEIKINNNKGKEYKVAAINKLTSRYQFITILDRNWASHSPGVATDRPDMVEVVVINNKVTEVRKGQPSIQIPQNGYVVVASSTWGNELEKNISVGDELTIKTHITPGIENIKLALGGGTLLVSDGKIASFTQSNVTGNHPRTAVGITKDRKQLLLVTVDGRHGSWQGIDGTRLARLMIELGSHEAVIMDGGGSTTMIARPLGSYAPRLINTPSDGAERRIINGLAVVSNLPQGNIQGIKAVALSENVFKDDSVELRVTAYDTNFNPFWVDASKVNYTVKAGGGRFEGNRFIPNKSGIATIIVEYLGKTTEVNVKVLEEPANLEVTPRSISVSQGNSVRLSVVGVDALGYRASLNTKNVSFRDTKGLGTIKDGVYTAGSVRGNTIVEVKYKNSVYNLPVAIGSQQGVTTTAAIKSEIKDPLYRKYTTKGTIVTAHMAMNIQKISLLDRYVTNNLTSKINSGSSQAIFTGVVNEEIRKQLKKPIITAVPGHSHQESENHLIIRLDNRKNGLRQTDFKQWTFLKNQLETTKKNNVFIVLPNPIWGKNGFTDGLEANLLSEMLTKEAEKGKNIFVLHGGEELQINLKDGVRYISTGTYQKIPQGSPSEANQYIEFNITGNSVTYQIKNLFE